MTRAAHLRGPTDTNTSHAAHIVSVLAVQEQLIQRPPVGRARVGCESSVLASRAGRWPEGEPLSQGVERVPPPFEVGDQPFGPREDLEPLSAGQVLPAGDRDDVSLGLLFEIAPEFPPTYVGDFHILHVYSECGSIGDLDVPEALKDADGWVPAELFMPIGQLSRTCGLSKGSPCLLPFDVAAQDGRCDRRPARARSAVRGRRGIGAAPSESHQYARKEGSRQDDLGRVAWWGECGCKPTYRFFGHRVPPSPIDLIGCELDVARLGQQRSATSAHFLHIQTSHVIGPASA
jgi:hypothetical protein